VTITGKPILNRTLCPPCTNAVRTVLTPRAEAVA
jgi:hypothetical protein